MKKTFITSAFLGTALLFSLSGTIASAQTSPTVTARTLNQNSLDTIALFQTITTSEGALQAEINTELSGISIEVAALPSMPVTTVNEQQALADELNALELKLQNLVSAAATLTQIRSETATLAATS